MRSGSSSATWSRRSASTDSSASTSRSRPPRVTSTRSCRTASASCSTAKRSSGASGPTGRARPATSCRSRSSARAPTRSTSSSRASPRPASTARRSRGTPSGVSGTRRCGIRTACRSISTRPAERASPPVKLLVTGGAGYLGSELRRQAPDALVTWHHAPVPGGLRLDIRDEGETARCFLKHGPDVVVHTAYVMGDRETIVGGSVNVALAAHRVGARLIHLSTDLVFDGEHGAPYREEDEPRPVMDYGQDKLEAEGFVVKAHPDALIVRTSLLYGPPDGQQESLARREDVEFFVDEIRSPIRVRLLAEALLELAA